MVGVYAVILLASIVGKGRAIAFAPQTFISPEKRLKYSDKRWNGQIFQTYANTGHKNVINKDNSIMIKSMETLCINDGSGTRISTWDDPNLDETVEHLEWAYQNRDELRSYGLQAGNDLKELTWKRCAEELVEIIEKNNGKFSIS